MSEERRVPREEAKRTTQLTASESADVDAAVADR